MNKKYLIISREGGDFSMDLIFAGLVKKFGIQNVIDYPARQKHRQGKPNLVGDDEKDYGAERRSLCYVDGCENLKEWTEMAIVAMNDIDGIKYVFLDETDESYIHYLRLFRFSKKRPKVVIIAGHDSFRGDSKEVMMRYGSDLAAMFIDDWQSSYDNLSKTYLINLSCNFDHLWDVENRDKYLKDKKYDICFIGYNSNPARKVVIDHIKEKWGHLNNCIIFEERPNEFSKFIRHNEMFKLMAQSKICLNLPGASTNGRALRYYEIPYVGSFMLSAMSLNILLEPAMGTYFVNFNELDKYINMFLTNTSFREKYASIDHLNCMTYHTVDARMNYIFEVLNGC